MECSNGKYPLDMNASTLVLRLDYMIGTMQIDGFLTLHLVQCVPHIEFYTVLKLLYISNPERKVYMGGDRAYSSSLSIGTTLTTAMNIVDTFSNSETRDNFTEDVDDVVVKAKKRKATGVSLFNAKKVIISIHSYFCCL